MQIEENRNSLAFKLLAAVAIFVALVVVFMQSPLQNLIVDSRFAGLTEGDYVKVRRSGEGVRLDIYATKASPARDYKPEFREFLETLPKLSGIGKRRLDLSNGETVSSTEISQINLLESGRVSWSIEVAAEVTLEELEFERFGKLNLETYEPIVAKVMAGDQKITGTLLSSAQGKTQADFWDGYVQFRATVIQDYRNTTMDPPDIQDICERFIDATIRAVVSQDDTLQQSEMFRMTNEVIEKSTDPLVHVYAARQDENQGNEERAIPMLSDSLDRLDAVRSPVTAFFGRVMQLTKDGGQRDNAGYKSDSKLVTRVLHCSDAMQTYLGEHPEHLRFAAHLLPVAWEHIDDVSRLRLLKSLLTNPRSDLWLTHTLLSTWHNDLGWQDRSYVMYQEVRPEIRESFSKQLHIAAWHALAAQSLRPDIPDSASLLNNIARTREVDVGTPRGWFIQGIQCQLDYMPFFQDYLLSLHPKWGGSDGQTLDFAKACAACTRLDTNVPYFAMTCMEKLQQGTGTNRNPWNRAEVRSVAMDLRRMLSASVTDERPTKALIQEGLNRCAAVALLAGDFDEARAALDVAEPSDSLWFEHYGLDRAAVLRRLVFARTGSAGSQVHSLEQQMLGGNTIEDADTDFDSLLSMIEEIRTAADNQWQNEYCDQRETAVRKFEQFFSGEPVELPFDAHQFIWRPPSGLTFTTDSSFVITQDMSRSESVFAELRLRFPPPYRLTVNFSIGSGIASAPGIFVYDADSFERKNPAQGDFFFANSRDKGVWHNTRDRSSYCLAKTPIPEHNTMELTVFADHYDVRLNGSDVPETKRAPPAGATVIGIGALELYNFATHVTFHDVVIQRLDGTLGDKVAGDKK